MANVTFKDILALIGALALIFSLIETLFRIIPRLSEFRKRIWFYIANKYKFKKFEKLAIASDIEDAVNEVVFDLQSELPSGWINKASIEWVDKETKINELKDGEMILRMKPLESQDENLLNGIYYFFSKALFPKTKEIIPKSARKAAALQISRRTINDNKEFLLEKFENGILETAIKEDKNIIELIEKYDVIDKRGFFTGSFLREIHEIATRSKFKELRNRFDQELKSVLVHIENFVKSLHIASSEKWSRIGPATSYAFLLVAQPMYYSVAPYLKRAKEHYKQGVERIYVMGTNRERKFVKKVISSISRNSDYYLEEVFNLGRDYRGEKGGIGALFIKNSNGDAVVKNRS